MLNAQFAVQRREIEVTFDINANDGEVLAIVGPNGAGKTTVLRALAGLDFLTRGSIKTDGHTWDDVSEGFHLEAAKRSTSLVLADPLLFPHMSVIDNVSFGMRARGVSRAAAAKESTAWLQRVGLSGSVSARATQLSTGQQQRVSLARALASDPKLLLLDEPLSAQDLEAKASLRTELKALLEQFNGVAVLVTHDPMDALVLATRVIVMEQGAIKQMGSPNELVRNPASQFVAQLLGLNLLHGLAHDGIVQLDGGGQLLVADNHNGHVHLAFPPHAVTLTLADDRSSPRTSTRNRWISHISEMEPFHGRVRVTLPGPPAIVAEVTAQAVAELDLAVGATVQAAVKATEVEVYPA